MVMTIVRPSWATKWTRSEPDAPTEFERPIATVTCSGGREEMVILLVQREGGEPEIYVDGRSFSEAEIAVLVSSVQMARSLAGSGRAGDEPRSRVDQGGVLAV
jgi:hypothetical protein